MAKESGCVGLLRDLGIAIFHRCDNPLNSPSKAILTRSSSGFLALGMGWYAPATGNWYDAILFENNPQDKFLFEGVG